MEGLDATEVLLSEVAHENDVLRCDAEYFGKNAVAMIHQLKSIGAVNLGTLANITDGIHTSIPFVDDGNVKILSAKHPKDNFINDSQFEKVTEKFHQKNPRTALRENDVLISTVGTIGNSAVVTSDILPANSDRHIGIIRPYADGLKPFFLSTFLTTRYGRLQSTRETTGNVQPNLFISKIARLLVPRFSDFFENLISNQVQTAYKMRKQAAIYFYQAEKNLLDTLGLNSWNPPEALSYIRTSSEAFAAGRLDAEHFQPKFQGLMNLLDATGHCVRLGDYLLVNQRGKQPDYADEGLPVINSKHVLYNEVRLDDSNRRGVAAEKNLQIQNGDVLLNGTGVGTIGRAAVYLHDGLALPDNHVTILRPLDVEVLDPVYLAVYLNSKAGQLQVEQRLHGSSGQIELYPVDVAEFRVWLAPQVVQQSIRRQVEQSFEQRQRTTLLLDAARRAVEIAIEDSESAALAWLQVHTAPI